MQMVNTEIFYKSLEWKMWIQSINLALGKEISRRFNCNLGREQRRGWVIRLVDWWRATLVQEADGCIT